MKKILIACQYAENKGDRAIAEYLMGQLQKIGDISVTLSATDPSLWKSAEERGVKVIYPALRDRSLRVKNPFLKRVVRKLSELYYNNFIYPNLINKNSSHKKCKRISREYLKYVGESDLVIITGGHHITSLRDKNALFPITYEIGLVSLFSKKYILWSQTIGPLEFSDNAAKDFFGKVLKNAAAVYIRDNNSLDCLDGLYGNLDNIKKSYDSVFGFGNVKYCDYDKREKKVGISIFNGLKKAFNTFESLAQLLDYYASQGYSIEFFRMEHSEKEYECIKSVINLMKTKGTVKIFPFESSTDEHLKEMSSCKFYIGYKTHSVIMALTTATPLIGICYHKKTRDFMADYGLADYAIDDELFTGEKGIELAKKLAVNAEEVHNCMCKKSLETAAIIEKDFYSGIVCNE